ncbi:hypothetical protein [Ohtaekwangia koreensis]|uniref:hypothetical protein n=1 Tax=Ohtaekwangia koreensis TaxID=688867 RepID=UPI0009A8A8BC|nr:hypothetical protein [Ohtaekwangia koreensis]
MVYGICFNVWEDKSLATSTSEKYTSHFPEAVERDHAGLKKEMRSGPLIFVEDGNITEFCMDMG